MRDVCLMRESLEGKIPPQITNDPEHLALLIAKIKKYEGITCKEDDNYAEERLDITRDNRMDIAPVKGQTSGESSSEEDAVASIRRKHKKHSHHRLREKQCKKKPPTRNYVCVDSNDSSDGNMHQEGNIHFIPAHICCLHDLFQDLIQPYLMFQFTMRLSQHTINLSLKDHQ